MQIRVANKRGRVLYCPVSTQKKRAFTLTRALCTYTHYIYIGLKPPKCLKIYTPQDPPRNQSLLVGWENPSPPCLRSSSGKIHAGDSRGTGHSPQDTPLCRYSRSIKYTDSLYARARAPAERVKRIYIDTCVCVHTAGMAG